MDVLNPVDPRWTSYPDQLQKLIPAESYSVGARSSFLLGYRS
ncbi:MAG: hypothetical protein QXO23_00650 [Candidatus Methanomethyliaceae archaeon]